MIDSNYLVKQLAEEIATPESGKQSVVLIDNSKTKVILFVCLVPDWQSMRHHS